MTTASRSHHTGAYKQGINKCQAVQAEAMPRFLGNEGCPQWSALPPRLLLLTTPLRQDVFCATLLLESANCGTRESQSNTVCLLLQGADGDYCTLSQRVGTSIDESRKRVDVYMARVPPKLKHWIRRPLSGSLGCTTIFQV